MDRSPSGEGRSWRRVLGAPVRGLRSLRSPASSSSAGSAGSSRSSGGRRVALGFAGGVVAGAGVTALVAALLAPPGRQPSVGSVLVDPPPVHPGTFIVQAREYRCGLAEIVGTHAEFYPKRGQYCRVRVDVTADEAAEDYWDSLAQQLSLSGGFTVGADLDATHIKRQPLQILLGGHETLEFDLWFDVPRDPGPMALLVRMTPSDRPVVIALPGHSFPFGAAG